MFKSYTEFRQQRDQNQESMVGSLHDDDDLVFCLFVLRFYGPVKKNGFMLSAVSSPNHTFTEQA